MNQCPDPRRRMRHALVAWMASGQDLGWSREGELSEENLAQLASLGYADGEGSNDEAWKRIEADCDCAWCVRDR